MFFNKSKALLLSLLITLPLLWLGSKVYLFSNTPLILMDGSSQKFLLVPGVSIKRVAYALSKQKLLKEPLLFILWIRISGYERSLKAGEYLIEPGITGPQMVRKMVRGEVINHAFTIIEGWNFSQIIRALDANPYIKHTVDGLSSSEIMEKIGHAGEHPEGKFAPDTYLFSGEIRDIELLEAAYNLMRHRLDKFWSQRADNLPYICAHEALIVASLIEKETAKPEERLLISGVILNRLVKGMLLQIDPTIIYGLGDKYVGKLRREDMRRPSTYNTYLRKGLPPTPICMPSMAAIEAALHPAVTEYLYYVAKGDGTHEFSTNLESQNRSIKKYLLRGKHSKPSLRGARVVRSAEHVASDAAIHSF